MKTRNYCMVCVIGLIVFFGLSASPLQAAEILQGPKAQEEQSTPVGVEVSTEELTHILKTGSIPVIDVRPPKEYEISHIPGSVNVFETEIEQMMHLCPDKSSGPVLY